MAGVPDLGDLRSWLQVAATSISDDQMQDVRDAEQLAQAAICTVPDDEQDLPADLGRALARRVGRHLAARQVPLGYVGDFSGEYGMAVLSRWDAEVERLELPHRIPVLA